MDPDHQKTARRCLLRGLDTGFGGFLALLSWPNRLHVFEVWHAAESLPLLIRALGGVVIPLLFLILPFWFLSRVIKLTNTWLYPKIFQPLEEKL